MSCLKALALALLLLVPSVPAHAADSEPATGWWSRTRLGPPVPVEAPSPVPPGGTWVAGDATGALAVSALRLPLAEGVVPTSLRLEVASAQGTPAIRLCPAVARWLPEQGGRLDSAPAHDCTVKLATQIEDGMLTAVLPPEFTLDALDVVLTPEPGSTFSVTFQPATAASVTLTAAPGGPPTQPEPAPAPPAAPADHSVSAPLPAPFAPAVDLPGPPAPAVVAAPLLPAPAPMAAPAPRAAAPAVPAALARRDDRRESVPAAVLFVLLAALAVRLQMQPGRPPRRLGGGSGLGVTPEVPAATAAARGVGRFRGVRTGKPVRL